MHGSQPRAKGLIWLLAIVGMATAGGLVGCNEETDLVTPGDDPIELPVTPTGVVDSLAFALARQDSQGIDLLLADDFEYHTGDNAGLAGLAVLERDRFLRALANFCRRDTAQTCVPTEIAATFAVNEPWATGSGEFFPDHGVLQAEVAVSLSIQGDAECPAFAIAGTMDFFVEGENRVVAGDTLVVYRLLALRDHTPACGNRTTWTCFTKLICSYLPAGLPRAELTVDRVAGTTIDQFLLDGSPSGCGGLGLHAEPYRWRVGDDPVWSMWRAKPDLQVSFTASGRYPVVLEVRNTLGWTSSARIDLDVYAAQPTSFEDLLGTIAYAHRIQDEWLIGSVLAPTFEFVFAPSDVATYDLPLDGLSFPAMMRAISRLFGNLQPHDGPPLVTEIGFQWDAEPVGWSDLDGSAPAASVAGPAPDRLAETHVVYIEAVRDDAETLRVVGPVYVTASPTLVVAEDGRSRQVWRLLRIRDKSNERGGPDDQTISWGRLLALYYF